MGRAATDAAGTRTPESALSNERSTVPKVSVAAVDVIQSANVWHSSLLDSVEPGSVGLNWPRGNRKTSSPWLPQPVGTLAVPVWLVSETVIVPASRSTLLTYPRAAVRFDGSRVWPELVPLLAEATRI